MRVMCFFGSCCVAVLLSLCPPLSAQETLMIKSTITGSQEQPKVLTIVPWKNAQDPEYYGKDISGIEMKAAFFRPINRKNFQRKMRYISSLKEGK